MRLSSLSLFLLHLRATTGNVHLMLLQVGKWRCLIPSKSRCCAHSPTPLSAAPPLTFRHFTAETKDRNSERRVVDHLAKIFQRIDYYSLTHRFHCISYPNRLACHTRSDADVNGEYTRAKSELVGRCPSIPSTTPPSPNLLRPCNIVSSYLSVG